MTRRPTILGHLEEPSCAAVAAAKPLDGVGEIEHQLAPPVAAGVPSRSPASASSRIRASRTGVRLMPSRSAISLGRLESGPSPDARSGAGSGCCRACAEASAHSLPAPARLPAGRTV